MKKKIQYIAFNPYQGFEIHGSAAPRKKSQRAENKNGTIILKI